MANIYRTKQETIEYFRELAYSFAVQAHRENDLVAKGKSEAYKMAAFELESNME